MSRQIYYTSKWENKSNYPEISLCISGKTGETGLSMNGMQLHSRQYLFGCAIVFHAKVYMMS